MIKRHKLFIVTTAPFLVWYVALASAVRYGVQIDTKNETDVIIFETTGPA